MCPNCHCRESKVCDSRLHSFHVQGEERERRKRRRECRRCHCRYTTYETTLPGSVTRPAADEPGRDAA